MITCAIVLHVSFFITLLTYQIINFKLQISILNLKSGALKAHSLISVVRIHFRVTTYWQGTASAIVVTAGAAGAASHETVGLLEDDVLQQRLGVDVLLLHLTTGVHGLAYYDALCLRLEQYASASDGVGRAVLFLCDADAREADLEDADACQADLLTHLHEVLHGGAQLVQGSLDVTTLQRGLRLDEVGNLVGLDELLVVDGLGIVLVVRLRIVRIVVL